MATEMTADRGPWTGAEGGGLTVLLGHLRPPSGPGWRVDGAGSLPGAHGP